jgi:hypothetical protein
MNPKTLLLSLFSLLALSFCQAEIVELTDATFEHQTQVRSFEVQERYSGIFFFFIPAAA